MTCGRFPNGRGWDKMPGVRRNLGRPLHRRPFIILPLFLAVWLLAGCERPDPEVTIVASLVAVPPPPTPIIAASNFEGVAPPTPQTSGAAVTPLPAYEGTPTPDPPHRLSEPDERPFATHRVSAGETLGYIAQLYGTTIEELTTINHLAETDFLSIGQELLIPTQAELPGPVFKIIPDSELVYGPAAKEFDVSAFAAAYHSRLRDYSEEVEGQMLSGPMIVQLVADRFSVNPRLLLALLEHNAGWVTEDGFGEADYPLGYAEANYEGLYRQLSWAANELNWGFYGRAEGGLRGVVLSDGTRLSFAPEINDGTAAAQNMLAARTGSTNDQWLEDSGPRGLFATYNRLFGNPFAYTVDPLWPDDPAQPLLQLPWASGETWYFTGGPHGGWASGSAWAALDFAPESEQLGCFQSDAWVTAMADGLVTRSDFGAVVVDLDGDGYAGTGWAVTYMHLDTRDRITAGTLVQTGDRLGHPSCEGGFADGTHVHVARTFNGRWVSADGPVPFTMGGWTAQGLGREYDGLLVRGEESREACGCREENGITAENGPFAPH